MPKLYQRPKKEKYVKIDNKKQKKINNIENDKIQKKDRNVERVKCRHAKQIQAINKAKKGTLNEGNTYLNKSNSYTNTNQDFSVIIRLHVQFIKAAS